MMLKMSLTLSLAFLVILPVTVLFTIYRIRKTRPLFRKRSKKLGEMNGYVEEILFGQKTIRAYSKEAYFTDEFRGINEAGIDAYYRADYQAALNGPSVTLISNISLAFVAMVGALLFLRGSFSLGVLASFILYSRRFSGPINEIAGIFAEFQSGIAAADRVFTLLEQPSEPADAKDAEPIDSVRQSCSTMFLSLIRLITPSLRTEVKVPVRFWRSSVRLVRVETTLINLLMRFYDPGEGEIHIDGRRSQDITREPQAFLCDGSPGQWLFQGTVRENIAYGKPGATPDEVRRAAEAAHIASFIESLPDGYDSMVSDGASNLSQGQKQLMTIARAMLLDTPMLILDEATSNVDSRTEIEIQDAMNKLVKGRTAFVIAHRLSTIQSADHILFIRDGQIVEQGTHRELIEKGCIRPYQAQFA